MPFFCSVVVALLHKSIVVSICLSFRVSWVWVVHTCFDCHIDLVVGIRIGRILPHVGYFLFVYMLVFVVLDCGVYCACDIQFQYIGMEDGSSHYQCR